MSQQEDPMQGAAASVQSGQEHEAKDVRSGVVEQNEHPEILSNGQAGAVAEGQGKETWVREGMQPVEVTGPEGGENTTAHGTAKAEVAEGDAQGGGRTIDTALSHHPTPTKSKVLSQSVFDTICLRHISRSPSVQEKGRPIPSEVTRKNVIRWCITEACLRSRGTTPTCLCPTDSLVRVRNEHSSKES